MRSELSPSTSANSRSVRHADAPSPYRAWITTAPRARPARQHRAAGGARVGSVGEAKSATVAARTSERANTAVLFDSAGLRRTLVDWYASHTAREAVATVLQPLMALGGARAERLITTLHVYLDERGSMTCTGKRLNLHRNAVAYRVRRAFDLLDADEDNPDDMLLLQLACRAGDLA
jgi:DNA-binding PucR family transcriptional regulator